MSDSPTPDEQRAWGATPPPAALDDPDRRDQPAGGGHDFLDRPLSSFTVRDLLKGYVAYVLAGFVVGAIGIAIVLSSMDLGDDGGTLQTGDYVFSDDVADAPEVTAADIQRLELGMTRTEVEQQVGNGEEQQRGNPFDRTVGGQRQQCFAYRLGSQTSLLCYLEERLVARERI